MVVTKGLPDPPGHGVQAKDRSRAPSEGGEPSAKQTGCLGFLLKVLKFIAEQWLIIGFALACVFGYLWPGKRCPDPTCANRENVRRLMGMPFVEVASKGGIIRSEYSVLYGSVGIIFFVSGLQLSPEKLRMNLSNWRLHIITQGISFILIPLIWLGMFSTSNYHGAAVLPPARLLPSLITRVTAIMWIIIAANGTKHIEPAILVGMLVLSCLPTTIASNVVMTRNAGGDDAAAIIEVVIGNVFGSFLCPGLIYAFIPAHGEFSKWTPSDASGIPEMYRHVAMQLGLSVLVPIGLGQTLRVLFKKRVLWALDMFCLAKVSTFFLCTLVW